MAFLGQGFLDRIQSKRLVRAALAQKILGQELHRMADDRFDLPPFAIPSHVLVKTVIPKKMPRPFAKFTLSEIPRSFATLRVTA